MYSTCAVHRIRKQTLAKGAIVESSKGQLSSDNHWHELQKVASADHDCQKKKHSYAMYLYSWVYYGSQSIANVQNQHLAEGEHEYTIFQIIC